MPTRVQISVYLYLLNCREPDRTDLFRKDTKNQPKQTFNLNFRPLRAYFEEEGRINPGTKTVLQVLVSCTNLSFERSIGAKKMIVAHSRARTAYAAAAALLAIAAVAAVATTLGSGRWAAASLASRPLGDDIIGFPQNGARRPLPTHTRARTLRRRMRAYTRHTYDAGRL